MHRPSSIRVFRDRVTLNSNSAEWIPGADGGIRKTMKEQREAREEEQGSGRQRHGRERCGR